MAEVLGIVASGVSIVSLAAEVARSVRTIKDLWADIKDADKSIKTLIEELETISTVLMDIAEESKDQELETPLRNSNSLARSLNLCHAGARQLRDIVDDIQKNLASKGRKWARVRLFLQKDKVTKFRAQLESAKSSLVLSHQCFIFEVYRKDRALDRIDDRTAQSSEVNSVRSYPTPIQQTCSQNQYRQIKAVASAHLLNGQSSKTSCTIYNTPFGTVISRVTLLPCTTTRFFNNGEGSNNSRNQQEVQSREIRFIPSTWLWSTGYALRLDYLPGFTQRWFVSYNIIPYSAPIFDLVKKGRLDEIKRLFYEKKASAFDVDPGGYNLIHYAASTLQCETLRFLLEFGLDTNALGYHMEIYHPDGDEWPDPIQRINTPFLLLVSELGKYFRGTIASSEGIDYSTKNILDIVRLLVSNGTDPMVEDDDGRTILHGYYGPDEPFSFLLRQDMFVVALDHRDQSGHKVIQWQCWHERGKNKEEIGQAQNVRTRNLQGFPVLPVYGRGRGRTALHWALQAFCHCYYNNQSMEELKLAMIRLIRRGADVHARSHNGDGQTPLYQLVWMSRMSLSCHAPRKCQGCAYKERVKEPPLDQWLDILSEAGVDIRKYLQTEKSYRTLTEGSHNGWIDLPYLTLEINENSDRKLKVVDHWFFDKCFCFDEFGHPRSVHEILTAELAFVSTEHMTATTTT